jgi:[ribosomal protein S5]-alanine N-acetyltransferase
MLETLRLKLVPLTHEQLLLFKNDPKALADNLNVKYVERQHDPKTAPDLEEAKEFWLKNTKEHSENFQWFTNWEIIVKDEQVAIGGIGFAGMPDESGKSMVGYGLDLRFHNRGYASEALQALLKWGFQNEHLKTAIADTPLLNFPSQRVLEKNGFQESHRNQELISWYLNRK